MQKTLDFIKEFSKAMLDKTSNRVLEEIETMNWDSDYKDNNNISAYSGFSEYSLRFKSTKDSNKVDIDFSHYWDEELINFFTLIEEDKFLPFINGISLNQPPDYQVNGIYYYRLNEVFTNKNLPNIINFRVQPFKTYRGYVPFLWNSLMDANPVLNLIFDKMPNLEELIIPNTMSKGFDNTKHYSLKRLFIQNIGDADSKFLEKLAKSSCFSQLEHFVYMEWNKELEDLYVIYGEENTFEDYLYFFQNANLPKLKKLDLRGVKFGKKELGILKKTKLGMQLESLDCYKLYTYDKGNNLAFSHLEKGKDSGFHYNFEFV